MSIAKVVFVDGANIKIPRQWGNSFMAINPSQGLNLGGQSYAYSDSFSSLNLFHGADAWITFDANGQEQRGQVATDTKGWVPDLPVVNGQTQTIYANIFYTKIIPPGDYIVEWTGEGTLSTYSTMESMGSNKFRIKFEGSSATDENGISLFIDSTDPNNTGNYIRDIKVYQEKYSDLLANGEHFDPKWFQQVDDFRVLRTHDWQGTNFSKVTDWTPTIVTADQAFWVKDGRGMPFELLVEMANETRSDLWINVPHMATDQYMREAAAYVKQNLDKDLNVYVEYTNEYWTTIFDQHPYLNAKGAELFGNAPFANAQAYGARASEMTQIFKSVFGSEDARLIPTVTLNHNAFNTTEALTMLTTPAYVAKGGISPLDAGIKFLGTDGYLSWFNTDPATDAMVDQWMTQPDKGFGAARDFLINQLNTDLAPAWTKGRALSDQYGLKFGVYEGGALLLNGDYQNPGAPRFTQFNEDVQLSPEMRQVYEAELAAWKTVGSGPFAWYSDTGRWGPWGDYGLWNAPDFTPEERTKAIIEANKLPPWWTDDPRGASTFDNGKYDAGTATSDTMSGTALSDRLYGLAGDDRLDGLAGKDMLVGGLGNDIYTVDNAFDVVIEKSGGGTADRVLTTVNYTLSANQQIELFSTTNSVGTGAINLSGNNLANIILGNDGKNRLDGGGAVDRMTGLKGDDLYFVDSAADVVVEAAGGGFGDRILASVNYTMGAGQQVELFSTTNTLGTAAINLVGNAFANRILGNNGANVINGGGGNDYLTGALGAD